MIGPHEKNEPGRHCWVHSKLLLKHTLKIFFYQNTDIYLERKFHAEQNYIWKLKKCCHSRLHLKTTDARVNNERMILVKIKFFHFQKPHQKVNYSYVSDTSPPYVPRLLCATPYMCHALYVPCPISAPCPTCAMPYMCHALYVPCPICAMPYVCNAIHGPGCTCATLYMSYPMSKTSNAIF